MNNIFEDDKTCGIIYLVGFNFMVCLIPAAEFGKVTRVLPHVLHLTYVFGVVRLSHPERKDLLEPTAGFRVSATRNG